MTPADRALRQETYRQIVVLGRVPSAAEVASRSERHSGREGLVDDQLTDS